MALSPYTAPEEVRAVLGVSDDEIDDATLALAVYETGLAEDLYDVDPRVPSTFTSAEAVPEEDRTDLQRRFLSLTKLFATYSVAKQAGAGLAMFAPKTIGDGKASMSRHADSPYKETLQRIDKLFDLNRERLAVAFDALVSGGSARPQRNWISISVDGVDVVTGEGF